MGAKDKFQLRYAIFTILMFIPFPMINACQFRFGAKRQTYFLFASRCRPSRRGEERRGKGVIKTHLKDFCRFGQQTVDCSEILPHLLHMYLKSENDINDVHNPN